MVWRKRASPAPAFKQPAAYNPLTGQHAPMGREGLHSRIAIFQVIEEDVHDSYVVCKGYDLDTDADCRYEINTIPVAKPYSLRGKKPYKVGMMLTCGKPRTKFGDNSGMAETTVGQPADLNEDIVMLEDDDGKTIQWMILDSGISSTWLKVKTGFVNADAAAAVDGVGYPCDWDGVNTDGATEIDFSTPIRDNKATALFTDYVIEVEQQKDGTWLVVSDCFDDPMDTVRLWDSSQDPPDGWSIFTEMAGRFPVGVVTAATSPHVVHTLNATGGAAYHNHSAHSVSVMDAVTGSPSEYKCIIAASSSVTSFSLTHNDVTEDGADPYCHLPPWLGLYFIKRTS